MMNCNPSAQEQIRTRKLGLKQKTPRESARSGEALSTDYYYSFKISGHLMTPEMNRNSW